MADLFLYDSPENHVERRSCIATPLRANLFDIPREQWREYPAFNGEAEFWTQIHEGLLGASAQLADWSGQVLALDDPALLAQAAPRLKGLGQRLVHHAHGHHHIEDHHFFPVFLKMFPQLEHPLEMLDGDHKVLAQVLDDLEGALAGFPLHPEGSDREKRDQWLKASERLLPAAKRLDALFIRHIGDEEEICIPTMLKWQG